MKRREFISTGFQSLAGYYLLSSFPLRALGAASGRTQVLVAGGNGAGEILWMELETRRQLRVKAAVMPHSFLRHPLAEMTVVVIEKAGTKAAVCDFRAGKVEKLLQAPDGCEFYGHGVFSADGKTLYITRVDRSTGIGSLVAYDSKTYKEQGQVQVAPGGIHDSYLLSDKKTLLVTSSGLQVSNYSAKGAIALKPRIEKTSLVHLDLESGKVKSKQFLEDEDQAIGHFAVSPDEKKVVAITIPFVDGILSNVEKGQGGVYTGTVGGAFKKIQLPKDVQAKVRGEMLSVLIDADKDRIYATNPNGSMVFEIRYSTDQLVKAHALHVNGLALWRREKDDVLLMNPTLPKEGQAPMFAKDAATGRDVAFSMPTPQPFSCPHLMITSSEPRG